MTVTVLAVLAAVAGIVAIIGVLAGVFLIHGPDSLSASDAVRVVPGLLLAGLYVLFARAAWGLKQWGWTLGGIVGVATVAYLGAILAVEWAELMRDAPPLAWMSVAVIIFAAVGLVLWFRPPRCEWRSTAPDPYRPMSFAW